MGKFLSGLILSLLAIFPFAAAQSTLSDGTIKFWMTWFYVPAKYLVSWQSIVIFAVVPVLISIFFVREIWKDIGFFHSGAVNFWIPLLVVYMMLRNGFWDYVDLFVSNVQMLPALVLSFFALLVTGKLRSKVTSFGYSGPLGGTLAYALDAIGMGIFFGGLGFVVTKGHLGPIVYTLFFIGAAAGILLIWWDAHGKAKQAKLSTLLDQYDTITKQMEPLEKKLVELEKKKQAAITAKRNFEALDITQEMVAVNRQLEGLRAEREAISVGAA